jgi:cation diffusion facilitator CzcD-associated flavoprotein CzcO
MTAEHFDVIIMGAGLSGIGAGYRLQTRCPGKTYAILEARPCIGGTWDLFRYPGIRSDSDMFTLGYPFRPWKEARAIADGPSILKYVRDTARDCGIDRHIRFNHRVVAAVWSSADNRWTVTADTPEGPANFTCRFLYGCTGYYRYDAGYQPQFPGFETYRGIFVHPQKWPQDLDYSGKRVAVIGSGATAVTLVPAMAETAAHVTMLQRSPTYVLTLPAHDSIANFVRRILPERTAHTIVRWKNILIAVSLYQFARRAPEFCKRVIKDLTARHLPPGYDVNTHFTPRYNPWDQRLCLVPDSDLFRVLSDGRASIATGEIDTFTGSSIRLKSGETLPADIIVSATGLRMLALGGVQLTVDGAPVEPSQAFVYKGVMLGNVPNFAFCVGYTNASWTLRADLSSLYVTRILNHMQRHNYHTVVPACDPSKLHPKPLLDFNSGYVLRALDELPRQGSSPPWFIRQNYLRDAVSMKLGRINDGVLRFAAARTYSS